VRRVKAATKHIAPRIFDVNKSAPEPDGSGAPLEQRRVWDLPTRLFHWALVATVATGLYLGEFRDFSTINLHFYAGYATAGLLVFRILWGLIGSPPSRLKALFPTPRRLFAYVTTIGRRQPSGVAGHNPLGALSVVAMMAALIVQIVTGLFAEDDALFSEGPFSEYISESSVITMTSIHYLSSRVILFLIATHIAAVFFYWIWKRENLIKPMISGWKWVKRND